MGLRHVGKESVDAAPQDGAEASTGFDYLRLPPEVRDMVRSNLDKPTLSALSLTGRQAHIDDLRTRLRARREADRKAEEEAGKIYDETIPKSGIPGHPYLHTEPEAGGNDDLVAANTYVNIVGRLARHLDDDRQKDFVEKIRSADDSIKFECLAAIGRYVGDFKPHNRSQLLKVSVDSLPRGGTYAATPLAYAVRKGLLGAEHQKRLDSLRESDPDVQSCWSAVQKSLETSSVNDRLESAAKEQEPKWRVTRLSRAVDAMQEERLDSMSALRRQIARSDERMDRSDRRADRLGGGRSD